MENFISFGVAFSPQGRQGREEPRGHVVTHVIDFPSTLLLWEESEHEASLPQKARGVCTACFVYQLKLFVKFMLAGPRSGIDLPAMFPGDNV